MGTPWETNLEGWRSKVKSDLEPRGRLLAIAPGLAPRSGQRRAGLGDSWEAARSGEIGEKTVLSCGFRLVSWLEKYTWRQAENKLCRARPGQSVRREGGGKKGRRRRGKRENSRFRHF